MTKSELEQIFDQFARTAIKEDEDGYYLFGNNINVTPMGSFWDVFLCNQKEISQGNMTAYLGTGKLNNLIKTIPEDIAIQRVDGEAWFSCHDLKWLKSWLLENRLALGIKKRVAFNPKSSNLAKNNAGTAPA